MRTLATLFTVLLIFPCVAAGVLTESLPCDCAGLPEYDCELDSAACHYAIADNRNEPIADDAVFGFNAEMMQADDAIFGSRWIAAEIMQADDDQLMWAQEHTSTRHGGTGVVLQPRDDDAQPDTRHMPTRHIRHVDIEGTDDCYFFTVAARQTLTPRTAGDDGIIIHRDVTSLGEMPPTDAWDMRGGADGVIHRTAVPLGTCDNLLDCAAHAQDTCEDLGYGDATSATLGDNDSCNYTCANGIAGHVTCL